MIGETIELVRLWRNMRLSADALAALRERKLRATVRDAYDRVSYYRERFSASGVTPDDIRTLEDLRKLPVTIKEDLRAAGIERILAGGTDPAACLRFLTSGTTGTPFTVYLSPRDFRTSRLVQLRSLLAIGYRPLDRLALVGPTYGQRPRAFQRLGFYRSISVSPLLPATEQAARLRRFKPTILWAYPTALMALIENTRYDLRELMQPRLYISSAEVLTPSFRRLIEAGLGAEVFNFYGCLEVGRIATECQVHDGLHVLADRVIVECLNAERPCAPGQPGEVVITALDPWVMPFIRYRLGDLATPMDGTCPCGSAFPRIHQPLGRRMELIRLPSGKRLPAYYLDIALCEVEPGIRKYRLIQERVDRFTLQLFVLPPPGGDTLDALRQRALSYLGEPVSLEIRIEDRIPDDGLKFRPFVSMVRDPGAVEQ